MSEEVHAGQDAIDAECCCVFQYGARISGYGAGPQRGDAAQGGALACLLRRVGALLPVEGGDMGWASGQYHILIVRTHSIRDSRHDMRVKLFTHAACMAQCTQHATPLTKWW